jgi:tetratricopeptide (TPR) repeat protein
MKLKLFVFIFLLGQMVFAQISIEKIDEKFQYSFNLDETKLDSMKIFAHEIEQDSKKIKYVLGICNSFRVRGYAAELEGKYKEASQYYMQGLKISEEQKSDEGKSGLLNDLGALNVSMKKYDKAKYFFKAALDLSQTLKVKPKPKKISSYYSNLGICYRKLNMVDSALYFYDKSLAIKKEIGDSAGIANIYTNLSGLLISQKKFKEAKQNLTYNLNFHTKKGQTDDLWDDHINMSNVERYLNNYPDAKKHLDEAMLIAKQLNSPAKISRTYENLALYFDETNDFKNAYYTYAKFHALDKELINTETNSAIEELETKYETEKK